MLIHMKTFVHRKLNARNNRKHCWKIENACYQHFLQYFQKSFIPGRYNPDLCGNGTKRTENNSQAIGFVSIKLGLYLPNTLSK